MILEFDITKTYQPGDEVEFCGFIYTAKKPANAWFGKTNLGIIPVGAPEDYFWRIKSEV